jgi:HEPN domain-containing protein
MRPEVAWRSFDRWMARVDGDLEMAAYARGKADLAWSASFHGQQAAEKALKAYLVWLSEERIPRTHDLKKLRRLVIERGGRTLPAEPLEVLNAYAVECRYPEEVEEVTPAQAREALESARAIVSFVLAAVAEEERPS